MNFHLRNAYVTFLNNSRKQKHLTNNIHVAFDDYTIPHLKTVFLKRLTFLTFTL